MAFINMMDSSVKNEPLHKVIEADADQYGGAPADTGYWPESWPEEAGTEKLSAIRSGNCNVCGGWGHHGHECTTARLKDDGKGGKGGGKGGGKAKEAKSCKEG